MCHQQTWAAALVGLGMTRSQPSRPDFPRLRKFVEIRLANGMCYIAGLAMKKLGSALIMLFAVPGGAGKVWAKPMKAILRIGILALLAASCTIGDGSDPQPDLSNISAPWYKVVFE